MISVGILIGIIEDKIANDLSSGKTTKEHLEDIKETIKNYKNNTTYSISIRLVEADSLSLKELIETNKGFRCFENIISYEIKDKFLILTENNGNITMISIEEIKEVDIYPNFKEVDKDDNMCSN